MIKIVRRLILLISLASTVGIFPKKANATHLAGSDISYTCLGGNTYRVELTFYRDCAGSPAPLGVGIEFRSASCNQYFTDTLLQVTGTGGEITYPCPTQVTRCEDTLSTIPGIQQYRYTGIVTLPMRCADWVISWSYCCRNCDITTMVQQTPCVTGSNPGMYIASTLDNLNFNCNSSPTFTNIPVSFVCVGQNFNFNHGVTDPDGDSLVYSFVNPMQNVNDSIPFVSGYSATNPITSSTPITINSSNGDLNMTPSAIEVGILAVLVQEYRNGMLVGSVVRDMQVYVTPCNNNLPTASGINGGISRDTTVCPGTNICFDIFSNDLDSNQIVTMTWNQGIAGATFNVSGTPHPTGRFCWTTPSSITGTPAYTFTVTVRDDACPNSGFQTFSYTIRVSSPIGSMNISQITCNRAADGSITVNPANPGGSYSYAWTPGGQTTQSISPLDTGTYTVVVTDLIGGCMASQTITLTDPPVMTMSAGVLTQTCAGTNSGIAFANVQGGVGPYQYFWNTTPPTLTDTAYNLAAGVYTVIVTDSRGCSMTDSVTINPSASAVLVSIDSSFTELLCFGDFNGYASISATGGIPGYTYAWNTNPPQFGTVVSNLPAGTYIATATDSAGCTGNVSVTINQPPQILISNTNVPATCNMSDGSISVTVSGGTPSSGGYEYLWNTNDTTSSIINIPAGIYTVTVTDSNSCSVLSTITLNNTNIPSPNAFAASNVSCFGANDGIAVVQDQGGTPPFTYLWNTVPPSSNDTVFNLSPGIYIAQITDSNGCIAFDTVQISEPALLSITVSGFPNCPGDSVGYGTVQSVSGGTGPFSYLWSPMGGTGQTSTGLPAGIYTVTVTDANGCTESATVNIIQPPAVSITLDNVVQPSCFGGSDGSIDVTVTGGAGPNSYFWNPGGATSEDLANIDAGIYILTVTNSGCTYQLTVNVNQPPSMNISAGADTAICGGNSIQLSGSLGSGSSGVWSSASGITFSNPGSPNATASNIPPGFSQITWTVTGPTGCTESDVVEIFNYNRSIFAGNDTAFCGTASWQLNAQAVSGFNGSWSSTGFSTFDNTAIPNATVTVIDYGVDTLRWTISNNACVGSDDLIVTSYQPVNADPGHGHEVCIGEGHLHAEGFTIGTGLWSVVAPGQANILSPNTASSDVNGLQPGRTIFLWQVSNGLCSSSDTVSIYYDQACELELPTGFSPNGDGFNDGYYIKGIEAYPLNVFRVFNRWGNEVYVKDNYRNTDWIGQNTNGDELPEGTYYVILAVKDSSIRKSTFVDLRRKR
ncbi:MAG: hypothetical protein DWQ44_08835 [Bacteroidetes bacterium]|nr:MAG: hypothetical protein DWQ33_13760 [Bacteroidota bacterium]REK07672.1 MAG: hypothetical protein DWQ39_01155 [Bacteroidota bacterium]REK33728.1 MAG: hypothetical protein DWQ44_08835 [Bacteroidota bacterium]REK49198.1 MAG: hypothetical protein DWQ48_08035 [Bacteroidota bacterium]